jgi:hypothetical protein
MPSLPKFRRGSRYATPAIARNPLQPNKKRLNRGAQKKSEKKFLMIAEISAA